MKKSHVKVAKFVIDKAKMKNLKGGDSGGGDGCPCDCSCVSIKDAGCIDGGGVIGKGSGSGSGT